MQHEMPQPFGIHIHNLMVLALTTGQYLEL